MRRISKIVFLVLISLVMTFGANVISWVPPYFIDECLPTATTGMLNKDFGGVKMADGLTHLALQFWNPNPNNGSLYYGVNGGVAATDNDVARFKQWGKANNVKILLCVYNTDATMGAWNWSYVKPIIDNSTLRTKFVNNLVQEMKDHGLDGIEIDLENGKGGEGDAPNFLKFISELSGKVRAEGKILTVASFHSIYNIPNHNMWNSLFPLVDGVSSMGYDDIGANGSGYQAYSYQKSMAPDSKKLMLGMPTYAGTSWLGSSVQQQVDWAKNNGVGVGVWDASLGDGNGVTNTAWRQAGVWKSLKAIKDASGNGGGGTGGDDPTNPSSNMISWAYWSTAKDPLSTNNSGAEAVSNGIAKGSFSLAAGTEGSVYTWGNLTAELPTGASNNLSGVDFIKVTYKSNNEFKLVLPQAPLDNEGKSYFYTLPASPSKYTTETIAISRFAQPDWVGTATTPLALSKVTALKFQLDGISGQRNSGQIEVKDLVIYNYSGEETGSGATYHTVTGNAGTGGSISPSGAQSVEEGKSQDFIIKASNGYEISNVTVDGVSKGAVSSVTVPNVTKDIVVSATFKTTSGGGGVTPTGKPADFNGNLHVEGRFLVNEHGDPIQLRGMSTHGIQYFQGMYEGVKADSVCKALANHWEADVIRISSYVNEGSGFNYAGNEDYWHSYIDNLVNAATKYGIYAIIDWHMLYPGDPNHADYNKPGRGAAEFWEYMARKHGGKSNVIFEICNEPNDGSDFYGGKLSYKVTWPRIKTYAERIIKIIRDNDPDNATNPNVVIVGTPTWASEPHSVIGNRIADDNVMYTLHFYAATHTAPNYSYYSNLQYAISNDIPVFVTEFGTQDAAGEGANNFTSSQAWLDILAANKISWVNWNFSDDHRSGAVFVKGTQLNTCADYVNPYKLKEAGKWILDKIKNPKDDFGSGGNVGTETSNMLKWASWEAKVDEMGSTIDTGSALVINNRAKATFSLVKNDVANSKYSWGSVYASLPKGDKNNLNQVKKIKVRYRSTVPAKLSIPMPVDNGGQAYYVEVPASSSFKTVEFNISRFVQPSWAADENLEHPLNLAEVTSIVFNIGGDNDAKVNGYIEIDSLTLFNYQGEETGSGPVITTETTQETTEKILGRETVEEREVLANKDTVLTTIVIENYEDSLFNVVKTFEDGVLKNTERTLVSVTKKQREISREKKTLPYQPNVTKEESQETTEKILGRETVEEREVLPNKDTVLTTILIENYEDSLFNVVKTFEDGVLKNTERTIVSVTKKQREISREKKTLPYQPNVTKEESQETTEKILGRETVEEREVLANKDTVLTTIIIENYEDSLFNVVKTFEDGVLKNTERTIVSVTKKQREISREKKTLPYQPTVTTKESQETTRKVLREETTEEREVLENKDTVVTTIVTEYYEDSLFNVVKTFHDDELVDTKRTLVSVTPGEREVSRTQKTIPYGNGVVITNETSEETVRKVLREETTKEQEVLVNKDIKITTIVTEYFEDSLFAVTKTFWDGELHETTRELVSVTPGEREVSRKVEILTYVPIYTEEKSTSVEREVTGEETKRDTTLNYNDNGDTLVTVTVTELYKEHTIEKTDSLKDGVVFKTTYDTLSTVDGSEVISKDETVLMKKVAIIEVDGEGKAGISEPVFAPNPVYKNEEGTVFRIPSDLKGDWNIEIRDAVGNLIDKASINSFGGAAYKWDLRNQNGTPVTNGMYVAIIRYRATDGSTKIFKKMIGVRE